MKTDKLLKLIQQKKAIRSGGALPLPKAQAGYELMQVEDPYTTAQIVGTIPGTARHMQGVTNLPESPCGPGFMIDYDETGNYVCKPIPQSSNSPVLATANEYDYSAYRPQYYSPLETSSSSITRTVTPWKFPKLGLQNTVSNVGEKLSDLFASNGKANYSKGAKPKRGCKGIDCYKFEYGGLAKAQEGRSYYDPFTDEVHLAQGDATDDAVKEHELYHRYQNMVKDSFRVPEYYPGPLKKPVIPINIETNPQVADYYNRKGVEIEMFGNDFLNQQPSFMFAPRDLIYNRVIDPQMYDPMLLPAYFEGDYPYPYTIEAEAQLYENAVRDGLPKHARLPNEVRYKKGGLAKVQHRSGTNSSVRESTNVVLPVKQTLVNPDNPIEVANSLLKQHNVKVDSTGNVLKDIGLSSSAYYNPITRTINYKNQNYLNFSPEENKELQEMRYINMVAAELPHAIQADSLGVLPFLGKIAYEGIKDPTSERYRTKGTLEHHAHEILEPTLSDKIYSYTPFSYMIHKMKKSAVNKKANGGLAKAQTGLPTPYLNPATVQAVLAKANQPVTNTLGRVVSTPASREKERREKIIAKDPSKYSIEDYKQGIKEPGADNSVLSDPIAMAAMLAALPATGAAAAASYPTRFLTNLGDEFIFNTLAGVDPTSIVPTALSFGTKGSLTDKFIKAYDEAGKRAFRVNPTSGIIVDLPLDFNVDSKTAKNEIAKKLSEIGIYPRGETVQDITNSVLNPNVNSPIVSMIRNNPDLRRKLAIVTRDLNKHYNLDIDLNNIQTEEQLNNLLNKATDFLNSNSPIASNVRSVFSDNDLRTLRSDLLETINNNQRQSSTRSYQFPNSNITGRKLGNTDFTFQGPSGATMNFEIVPEDKIANHFLFVNRAGSSPNPRQARLDAGNMFRLTTENAPRGFRVTENNMSLDSHPLLWSLGSEGKPFRLLNPYEFYLNSSGFNPDRSLAWDPIITRWTDQALDLGLTESEKNLLLYQVPNNMGRYNPYTDVIYQTMTDNQTMANAINAQNSILNISNTGLQSQFDRGLIPEEMYNANIVKWLANPSNPSAGLSIKPPKIEDYMLDWDIADRQRLLPFQIPNDSRMRHPFFTKLAPTSFLPNPMFSSDPLTREAAAAKNVYRYLLDPAGSIGKDAVLKQAIPIFEKIYRKGGKTRKVKITKRK